MRHGVGGDGGTGSAACEESQTPTASDRERALTSDLMGRICERTNLNRAYKVQRAEARKPDREVCCVTTVEETAVIR